MPLQEQAIPVRFAGGIETKMDSKAVPSARLLGLENGVFTKAISIKKRNGYGSLSRSIAESIETLSGARRLAVRGGTELLAFADARSYSHHADADLWVDTGAVISARGNDRSVVRTGTQQTMPDHAQLAGVSVFAWEDSRGGVWWTVRDTESGGVLKSAAVADLNGERPRCVAVGEALHIYYALPAQQYLMVLVINPATPTLAVTPQIMIEDLDSTNPTYDACPTSETGSPALIAWHEHATTNVRLGFVNADGHLGGPSNGLPSVFRETSAILADGPLAVAYTDENASGDPEVCLAYIRDTLSPLIKCYSIDGTIVSTTTTIPGNPTVDPQRIAAGYRASGIVDVAIEEAAAEPTERYCQITNNDPDDSTGRDLLSVGLASRAFATEHGVFAYFVHDSTYFNTYLALRLTDYLCVARQVAGGAAGAPTQPHLSSAHMVGDTVYTCLPQKERLASQNNDQFGETGLRLLELDFEDSDTYQTAQLGRGLYMGGACPQFYDGRTWSEQGFHVGPELVTTVNSSSGSLTSSSSYLYRVWYEWTDTQGEVHRGPENFGTVVTLGGAEDEVTLTLPTLRITQKTNVRICVARGFSNDATRLFRVTSLDPTTEGDPNGYVANDPDSHSVSFVDRLSDADLATQEPHYTNGGVLSNDPTSLGHIVVAGKNRLFATDMSEPNFIRYSQELAPGFGVEFTPELYQVCDPAGGAITALAVLDDKVVVFKESAIFVFNGDGPGPAGFGGGFSRAMPVPGGVGCSEPASIVETPAGLMFKSAKGIYQLDRALSVGYIGAPVETYNSQAITRATVMPDRTQVVFLTDSGSALLYDYLFSQWSTFTNHEGKDSVIVDGTYHYLRNDSRVFRETLGEYSDAGVRIRLRFETAFIHAWQHLQGLQRFWKALILGTWGSPHQLGVQYRTDYEDAWTDPLWLDATGDTSSDGWITGDNAGPIGEHPIVGSAYGDGDYGAGDYGGTPDGIYQWRIGIHASGQSIAFRFEDFEKSDLAGATFELTELLLICGIDKPDTRSFEKARSA